MYIFPSDPKNIDLNGLLHCSITGFLVVVFARVVLIFEVARVVVIVPGGPD